jgi:hypothetical protein
VLEVRSKPADFGSLGTAGCSHPPNDSVSFLFALERSLDCAFLADSYFLETIGGESIELIPMAKTYGICGGTIKLSGKLQAASNGFFAG